MRVAVIFAAGRNTDNFFIGVLQRSFECMWRDMGNQEEK